MKGEGQRHIPVIYLHVIAFSASRRNTPLQKVRNPILQKDKNHIIALRAYCILQNEESSKRNDDIAQQ